jgi:hypothetical protein
MRAIDAGLSVEPVVVDNGEPIELGDADFKRALQFHHIESR